MNESMNRALHKAIAMAAQENTRLQSVANGVLDVWVVTDLDGTYVTARPVHEPEALPQRVAILSGIRVGLGDEVLIGRVSGHPVIIGCTRSVNGVEPGTYALKWDEITEKPSTFPPGEHVHTQGDITGLIGALAGKVSSVSAGTNVTVDNTDPANPIINTTGGGGGGAVDSVNGETGSVVLDAGDIAPTATRLWLTSAERTKLSNTSGTNTGDQNLAPYALTSSLAGVALSGAYADLTGKPSIPTTLSALDTTVTGAQLNALKSKVDGIESGAQANVVPTWASVTGKPSTFPPSPHSHAQSDVTNLVTDMAAKASSASLATHTGNTSNPHNVTASQVGAYTKAETDAAIAGAGGFPGFAGNGVANTASRSDHFHDADDIDDASTAHKFVTAADITKLANTSGMNTGDQTSVTGNAGTATKLATPRTINGVAFDGSANITVADNTKVPTSRTVNGKALTANVTLNQGDVADTASYVRMLPAERTKLSGVEAGAQVNVTPTWGDVTGKPSTFPPDPHNHDDLYYTEAEVNALIPEVHISTGLVGNPNSVSTTSTSTYASALVLQTTTLGTLIPEITSGIWDVLVEGYALVYRSVATGGVNFFVGCNGSSQTSLARNFPMTGGFTMNRSFKFTGVAPGHDIDLRIAGFSTAGTTYCVSYGAVVTATRKG